jgi:hypothetical protein
MTEVAGLVPATFRLGDTSPRHFVSRLFLSLPGLTGQSSNPRAIDVSETLPDRDSGGYWIARSSRAMTVARDANDNQSHTGEKAGLATRPVGRLRAEMRSISSAVRRKSSTSRFSAMRSGLDERGIAAMISC